MHSFLIFLNTYGSLENLEYFVPMKRKMRRERAKSDF